MITEEEKQEIVERAVEKALLMLPEVVGNMMSQHAVLNKINQKFYLDHPEFSDKRDVVASVVEMVEGKSPLDKYDDILKKAVPEVRRRIDTIKSLDMSSVVSKPELDFHGEL